ncbi:MAG: tetratricopeptide repeat protein, partial [Gemmatimonadaceae bacterium]
MRASNRSPVLVLALLVAAAWPAHAQTPRCDAASGLAATRGWNAYRHDSISVARADFARALESCAVNSDAQVGLGFVALRENKLDEANRAFTAVTVRDSAYADAWDGLASTRNRRGDTAGAIAAARKVVKLDPKNASARALLDRLSPEWERAATPTVKHRAATLDLTARTEGEQFQLRMGNTWKPFYMKGVNMGLALPGKFPAEFPTDSSLFAGWLDTIATMNANVLRIYTILPPSFYRAVRGWNLTHPDRILYLVHGVWTELPPDNDFDNPGF